jgi:LysM repeat protein
LVIRRYLVHAVVLTIAVSLSGYTTIDKELPGLTLRRGSLNAEGLVIGEGGQVGDISLGRLSTIIQPVAIPTAAPAVHAPISYTVGQDETLAAIAAKFGVTPQMVRWSNPALTSTDKVSAGQQLVIPPVAGLIVTVKSGDTLSSLAAAYHSDPDAIVDFNRLRDDALEPGTQLVIPSGVGPNLDPQPAAAPKPRIVRSGPSNVTVGGQPGSLRNGTFPYGYCTWYVATRRYVPWSGNAWQWYGNARAMGYAEGSTPRVGAIMVTWESAYGHVAYVEAVNANGSWTVSEMNFKGWGIIDQRTISPGSVPLIGFIY